MIKPNPQLIFNRGLPAVLTCNNNAIAIDNANFLINLVQTVGILGIHPCFELHPYKNSFPLQSFEKYIIGTFPPISYILDSPQINAAGITVLQQPVGVGGHLISLPWIPFFHGNHGNMWDFLLTDAEMTALNVAMQGPNARTNGRNYLINLLIKNEINYSDIIDVTQRNRNQNGRYDGKDINLNNICPNSELICHILSNTRVKYLLFNSSSIFSNSGVLMQANGIINEVARSFDLFVRECQALGLQIELQIQSGNPATFYRWTSVSTLHFLQRRTKLAFEMKIKNPNGNKGICDGFAPGTEKVLTAITGPSPSAINQLGLIGNIICDNWLLANPGQNRNDFIRWVYQSFRNNAILQLYNFNN
jgi:hypothetical protein